MYNKKEMWSVGKAGSFRSFIVKYILQSHRNSNVSDVALCKASHKIYDPGAL